MEMVALCTSRPTNDLVCICLPLLPQENRTSALCGSGKDIHAAPIANPLTTNVELWCRHTLPPPYTVNNIPA
jgi:hypothetical protein